MVLTSLVLLILSQLLKSSSGLQVTPNSACSNLCIDNPTADVSDPNSSSTNGSDIVCTDSKYTSTPLGQKFMSCINCLQNSTANATSENDQEWFLYNIRFAFNTCLYNSNFASEQFSTPCSINTVCGSLATSLQTGLDNPSVSSQYSYCGANNETFGTKASSDCSSCLKQNPDQIFLANQLIALDAGCIQRPASNVLLGLDGSIFSSSHINITSPTIVTTTTKKKGLSVGSICGITAGGVATLAVLFAILFVCYRKRFSRRNSVVKSSLDPRYGNKDISTPIHGGYADYSERGPHTPSTYETVGLIKVPPPIKRSKEHEQYEPPEYDRYHASSLHPRHAAGKTHEEMARDLGFSMGTQQPSPPLVETQVVPVLYHPASFAKHAEYTPSEFSRASVYGSPEFSDSTPQRPLSSFGSGSASNKSWRPLSSSTNNPTTTHLPGLPSLPKRSPSFSPQNPTSSSAARNFSKRQTRDLTVGREDAADVSSGSVARLGQISGPIVSVGTRYEDEEEDAKGRREGLYRAGYTRRREDDDEKRNNPYNTGEDLW